MDVIEFLAYLLLLLIETNIRKELREGPQWIYSPVDFFL